jgi:RecA-family ATPase
VIYLGAEDEADELHRRLEAILRHYGASFKDIVGALHLLSYVGEDCLLGVPDHQDIIRPTELFQRILTDAIKIKPVSVMIDTLKDVYSGDEINRNQTTQFVKLLQHMAIKARCSVAILAHPSNAGMATGSGLSGSTGWHNKVRSRLYMRAPTTAKGEEIDSDVREIQFLKNNYGRQGDSIQIRWENGVFVPKSGPASFERIARDRDDEHRFLDLLAKYEGQGRKLSHKAAARDYAPRVFAAEKSSIGLKRFEQAMERLFERKEIHVAPHGPASRGWSHIARGAKEPTE